MKKNETYESWRDKLISVVSERICASCTDKRKENYEINYKNPLSCGCRCDRVAKILDYAIQIDEDIKKYSKFE